MTEQVSLIIPGDIWKHLDAHLFSGDHDEHGAIIAAGIAKSGSRTRLLARDLFLARDNVDYVQGKYGYRMLRAEFIYERIRFCRENNLAYLAVHNHGGYGSVSFSRDDMQSHERGYPALLDVMHGLPVGAVVFAKGAAAGDIWFPDSVRIPLDVTKIIDSTVLRLYSEPKRIEHVEPDSYDRQLMMFGALGQRILAASKIGVIGAGGVGSLIVEYLAHLGVGELLVADPDKIELSNISRVVGSRRWDTRYPLSKNTMPLWIQSIAKKWAKRKVAIAKRLAKSLNSKIKVRTFIGNFAEAQIAKEFCDCDFLFLAADSMQARLVFNAIVHQYLIPGMQIGSKVMVNDFGRLQQVFTVVRPVLPHSGCLWCNGLISRDGLAWEAKTDKEKRDQNYGTTTANPSVITLNAVGAAHAVNNFLMAYLDICNADAPVLYEHFNHLSRTKSLDEPRADDYCLECGRNHENSRFARGDAAALPTIDVNLS